MIFSTALNCMDGRVQIPVITYLQNRFNSECVDTITEAGINKVLAELEDASRIQNILERVKISIDVHKSGGIAVVGHHDCAGNPVGKEEQIKHIKKGVNFLKQKYKDVEIIGLWVDANWKVNEI
ncbi:hypothetical protein MNBD_IGNAVI01-1102 [hydrothermal vent metagenome]|uniref:Carbonic anhydrase n=1 Tax=hydrothermal vent metagenome TaxID=652676 RepID=A0A3B1BR10_9ZZZZ